MRVTLDNIYELTSSLIDIKPDISKDKIYSILIKIDPFISRYEPNINLHMLLEQLCAIIRPESYIKTDRTYRTKKSNIHNYIFFTQDCKNLDNCDQSDCFTDEKLFKCYNRICEDILYKIVVQNRFLSKYQVYNLFVSETVEFREYHSLNKNRIINFFEDMLNYDMFSSAYDKIFTNIY